MKKKIKIGFVVLVFIVVSVCGVSVYRHFTAPKKESVPLETVIQNSSDLTTQKMVISDVFECTKGKIPLLTKKDFLVQYRTTVTFLPSTMLSYRLCTTFSAFASAAAINPYSSDSANFFARVSASPNTSRRASGSTFNIAKFVSYSVMSSDLILIESSSTVQCGIVIVTLSFVSSTSASLTSNPAADANAENVVHRLYDNIVDGRKVVVEFK